MFCHFIQFGVRPSMILHDRREYGYVGASNESGTSEATLSGCLLVRGTKYHGVILSPVVAIRGTLAERSWDLVTAVE